MRIRLTIILLSFIITSNLFAQRIDTLINDYGKNYPVERIHLHFDKSNYAPGDTVWFKAYIVSGLVPDFTSKNLYVDFVGEDEKVLAHQVYPIIQGNSPGQFVIPVELPGKIIHVMAYTRWMLNFDSAFLFQTNLAVIHHEFIGQETITKELKTSIHFFPEGGDAVATLETRIAFLAENQFGQPVNVKGEVKDNKGNKVADLVVQKDGMGDFFFIPEADKKYTAFWTDVSGKKRIADLPEIKANGIALTMNFIGAEKLFSIERTKNVTDEFKQVHVVATMYQQVVYMANFSMNQSTLINGTISTKNLPSGIMQVTVFNKNWEPMAERIVYVKNNTDTFTSLAGFSKLNFGKRSENELTVTVKDSLPATLSLSITDAAIKADSNNNMISTMLLKDQIKGKINRPYYYFSDSSAEVNNNLDLLMLTHGWRRYNWNNVINKIPLNLNYAADTSYLYLSGLVSGLNTKELAKAKNLLVNVKTNAHSKGKMIYVSLEPNGSFKCPDFIFFDSLLISYQFMDKNRVFSNAAITFMNDKLKAPAGFSKYFLTSGFPQTDTSGNSVMTKLYSKYQESGYVTLKDVTVYAKAKTQLQRLDSMYASPLFQQGDVKNFDVRNDPSFYGGMNIFRYLEFRVPGLQVYSTNMVGETPNILYRGYTPGFFIDEIPVDTSDLSLIRDLNLSDIAMIKVIPPPFVGAWGNGQGGAIAIYMKRADDRDFENKKKDWISKRVEGYSAMREFYSPNYETVYNEPDKPDVRTTLYWNANLATTRQQHSIKLKFYNNDFTKSYRIIVEGMNSNGQFTHYEKIVQ